jgi:hypothetical protein
MSEQNSERGAAEVATGVPDTPEEHEGPASLSSTPDAGEPSRVDGDAEERAGVEDQARG